MRQILREEQNGASLWLARQIVSFAAKDECCRTAVLLGHVVQIDLHSHPGTIASARMPMWSAIVTVKVSREFLAWCVAKEA